MLHNALLLSRYCFSMVADMSSNCDCSLLSVMGKVHFLNWWYLLYRVGQKSLFLYCYLLIIVLFSIWTVVNLFLPHAVCPTSSIMNLCVCFGDRKIVFQELFYWKRPLAIFRDVTQFLVPDLHELPLVKAPSFPVHLWYSSLWVIK